MPEIIEVEVADGEIILAEVTVTGGDVAVLDRLKLAGATSLIRSVGRWAKTSVQDGLPGAPQRFGVEFGVKLALKSGQLASVLAEVAGEATLTVKMEWEPGQKETGDADGTGNSDKEYEGGS